MKFNIEDYRNGKYVMRCRTIDNASDVKVASNRYFYLPFGSGDIVHHTNDTAGTIEEKRIKTVTIIHSEDDNSIEFLCNDLFMFCETDIGESIFASRAEAKKHLNRN